MFLICVETESHLFDNNKSQIMGGGGKTAVADDDASRIKVLEARVQELEVELKVARAQQPIQPKYVTQQLPRDMGTDVGTFVFVSLLSLPGVTKENIKEIKTIHIKILPTTEEYKPKKWPMKYDIVSHSRFFATQLAVTSSDQLLWLSFGYQHGNDFPGLHVRTWDTVPADLPNRDFRVWAEF